MASSPSVVESSRIAPLKNLDSQAKSILDRQKDTAELDQNTQQEPITPSKVDFEALVTNIRSSALMLSDIVSITGMLNKLGICSEERELAIGEEILPVAVKGVIQRILKQNAIAEAGGSGIFADQSDQDLYNAQVWAHTNDFECPEWFKVVQDYLLITNRLKNLPQPIELLKHSPSAVKDGVFSAIDEEFFALREKKTQLETKGQQGQEDHSRVVSQIGLLQDRARKELAQRQDIDPLKIHSYLKAMQLETTVNNTVSSAVLSLYVQLGTLLSEFILPTKAETVVPAVECFEFIKSKDDNQDEAEFKPAQIARSAQIADLPESIAGQDQLLGQLLESYIAIHGALNTIYHDYKRQRSQERELQGTVRSIENALERLFNSPGAKLREILTALNRIDDPKVEMAQARLLVSKTPGKDKIFVDWPENIELLKKVIMFGIHGSNEVSHLLNEELRNTSLSSTIALCSKVRGFIEAKSINKLAFYLDKEIETYLKEDSKTFAQGAGLMLALLSVSEDLQTRKSLKGRIKNIADIEKVIAKMSKGLKPDCSEGKLLEEVRARISGRFNDNLSNYWGRKKQIAELRASVEDHLLLLRYPEAYVGLPSRKVFKNGYVFYGPPGSGKTYLATCLANEYGLPYLKISREEMAEVQGSVKGDDSRKKMEETLSDFIKKKIKMANDMRQTSGAPACVLMIDEMEAEFLKRNPGTSPREELIATNIMLRVIEEQMAANPEIIFIGATNHVELVDQAALRIGRYGLGVYLGSPEEEDINEIILGTLESLDIDIKDIESSNSEGMASLIKAAEGLMPEPISLAIANKICLERARALHEQKAQASLNIVPFEQLVEAVSLIKAQTLFKKNDSSVPEEKDVA